MFRTSKTTALQENATAAAELARQLAADKRFRKQVLRASRHAASANEQIRSRRGLLAALRQIAVDHQLRTEVGLLLAEVQAAWRQAEKKRHHRLRNFLLLAVGAATVVTVRSSRAWRHHHTEEFRGPQETQQQTEARQTA